jgi:ketosteroid isomerase-like protein
MQAKETVRRFIELINTQDVDGLYNLMTEDHRFVDALSEVVQGRDMMRGT